MRNAPPPTTAPGPLPVLVEQRFNVQRLLPALTPILVLAIAIIGYLLALRPKLFEIRTLHTRATIASEVPALEQRLAGLERVQALFSEQLSDLQAFVDETLPASADVPGLIATIDAVSQRAGVIVSSVEITRGAPPESFARVLGENETVLMGVGLRGVNYERIKAFLDVVAQSRRVIDTISVQFDPRRQSATLRLRAYTLAPEA